MINSGNSALAEDAKPTEFLYHGTNEEHLDSIRKHGIVPHSHSFHKSSTPYVSVSTEKESADLHADRAKGTGHAKVLKINRNHPSVKGLELDPDNHYPNGKRFGIHSRESFRTKHTIHPDAIHSVEEVD